MHVEVIDRIEALNPLEANWNAIYAADPEAQYFLSWPWVSNWLKTLNQPWLVLGVKPAPDSKDYVAVFPLQQRAELGQDGSFRNVLTAAGFPFAGFNGFLCDPRYDNEVIPAMAAKLQQLRWGTLHINAFHVSAARRDLFLKGFPSATFRLDKFVPGIKGDPTDYSLYPFVKLPADFETFLQENLGAGTRKNARGNLRDLDSGELRITHATAETFERDLEILMSLWEGKWRPLKGERLTQIESKYHRDMLRACFRAGEVLLLVLWKGEVPIGAQGTLIDRAKNTLVCLVGSRDLTIKKPAPGFILHVYSIRWAIENGFSIYDLQIGNHTYKYDFGPAERRMESMRISTHNFQNLGGLLDAKTLPIVQAEAAALLRNGRSKEAERGCRQILEVDPKHAGALGLLAQIKAAQTPPPKTDFEKALELQMRGQTAEAARIYNEILLVDPEHFDARHLLGVTFLERGQFDIAERHIGLAIKINPNFAPAHNHRGNALRSLGRLEEALGCYERAIALDPNNPSIINNRGATLYDLGRLQEALASFGQALALKPDYALAISNRDKVLKDIGQRSQSARARL